MKSTVRSFNRRMLQRIASAPANLVTIQSDEIKASVLPSEHASTTELTDSRAGA